LKNPIEREAKEGEKVVNTKEYEKSKYGKGRVKAGAVIILLFLLLCNCFTVTATEADGAGSSGSGVMMQVASKVNVRKEADSESESLGQLEEGEMIFLAGDLTGEWYPVLYQGQTGYIRQDFLVQYGSGDEALQSEMRETTEKNTAEHLKYLEEEEEAEKKAAEEAAQKEAEAEQQKAEEEAKREAGVKRNRLILIGAAVLLIAGYAGSQLYNKKKHASDDLEGEDQDGKKPSVEKQTVEDEGRWDDEDFLEDWDDEDDAEK